MIAPEQIVAAALKGETITLLIDPGTAPKEELDNLASELAKLCEMVAKAGVSCRIVPCIVGSREPAPIRVWETSP